MKSRLLKSAPFDLVELPSLKICLTDEELGEEINRHITNELLSHRLYRTADKIESGDIATVLLNGKSLIINVGSGLFDIDIEKESIGKSCGDTVKTDTLSVLIERIERLVIPSLTDSFVKNLNIDGISTVREYKDYLAEYYRNFYLENYLLYFAMEFFTNWMQASKWSFDEDELNSLLGEYRAMEKRYLDAHDTYIDGTEEELNESARENMMETVGQYLYLQYTDPQNAPTELHFDDEGTIEMIRSLALRPMIDYLKDKVTFTDKEEDF
jgi:hypothetical protein